jgi:hypothetical protein
MEALGVLGTVALGMEDLDMGLDTDLEARLVLEALEVRLALEALEAHLALVALEVRSALALVARLALEVLEAPFLVRSFSANLIKNHLTLCHPGNQPYLT